MLAAAVFGGLEEAIERGRLRERTLAASARAEGNNPASDKTRNRAALKLNKHWKTKMCMNS